MLETQFFVDRISAIFVFTLIISGNFLAQLFPCRIQEALVHNIFIKHLFGFLTLFFFGIVAIPSLANISGMISSFFLYIVFLINAKTKYQFWISVFVLYAVIYLLHIVKKEHVSYIDNPNSSKETVENYIKRNSYIEIIQNISLGLIFILTILGFLIYMGDKKLEYKDKFDYVIFFFGKPYCKDSKIKTETPIFKSLYNAFNM